VRTELNPPARIQSTLIFIHSSKLSCSLFRDLSAILKMRQGWDYPLSGASSVRTRTVRKSPYVEHREIDGVRSSIMKSSK
jgi:hypothetical protein